MEKSKKGIYLIGALGSISLTLVAGVLALKKKLSPPIGMVTHTDLFEGAGLVAEEDLVFGGCDIRCPESNCRDIFEKIAPIHPSILTEIQDGLREYQDGVDIGCSRNCGEAIENLAGSRPAVDMPIHEEIECIRSNLRSFRQRHGLDEMLVVNLASTEPPLQLDECHGDFDAFEKCLASNDKAAVRASTLYACAAIMEGCPYINFTPSNGALIPAMIQLAEQKHVPVMGNDGKTGETLVKSALAPMFAYRNLEVMSWGGFNILGNMDGKVLDNPSNKESKIRTKDHVLSGILGYSPHTTVSIDYVPSLDDQKTAWDFIHFRGFMGVKMSLQFVWQGYDSILAAPLVLDMIRLAELAKRRGEGGLMPHLAPFFKAPIGVTLHALPDQFRILQDYALGIKSERPVPRRV